MYTVYCHTNMMNGKMYVGITKFKPEKRWKDGRGYKTQLVFYRAIVKYGWDNFYHETVASGITKDEAENFEQLLIEKFELTNPKYGYNQSIGSNVPVMNDAIKNKLSQSTKQLWEDNSYRKMMSDAHKGKNVSQETKHKMSIAQKRRAKDIVQQFGKYVICRETGTIYESVSAAARQHNVSPQAIFKAIKKQRPCVGFTWQYNAL